MFLLSVINAVCPVGRLVRASIFGRMLPICGAMLHKAYRRPWLSATVGGTAFAGAWPVAVGVCDAWGGMLLPECCRRMRCAVLEPVAAGRQEGLRSGGAVGGVSPAGICPVSASGAGAGACFLPLCDVKRRKISRSERIAEKSTKNTADTNAVRAVFSRCGEVSRFLPAEGRHTPNHRRAIMCNFA